jgi:DNA-binding CsgD family transcriptional regulator
VQGAWQLHCGIAPLGAELFETLELHGISVNPDALWTLVLDAPLGFAATLLPDLDVATTVIVSDNPCLEYQADLSDDGPAALLPWLTTGRLIQMLQDVRSGQRVLAASKPFLPPSERRTLRLIAEGYDTPTIASMLGITEGTLRNRTHAIYTKLGLKSSVQLSHYYYGRWRLLEHRHGWRPPAKLGT